MSRTARKDPSRRITNLVTSIVAILFVVVGLLLMLLSAREYAPSDLWVPALLGQLGGLLVATGLITLVWDLFGKRAFADEVLSKTQLRADLVDSGLERLTGSYLADVEWEELFQHSRTLDIVVAYASTWRNTHRARLEKLATKKGGRIRVFLPDPDDAQTMEVLAARFSSSTTSLQDKVREAIDDFKLFAAKGNVEIYVRPGDAVFSCYQFDHKSVLTLYSHSQQRQGSVPTFLVGPGQMSEFIAADIKAIRIQSTRIGHTP